MLPKFVTLKDFLFIGISALAFLLIYDKYVSKKIETTDSPINKQETQ